MADIFDRDAHRFETMQVHTALILAPESAARDALYGNLFEFLLERDYRVARADTLAKAQRLVADLGPQFVFVECAQYPLNGRDIATLMRAAAGPDRPPPRVVGLVQGGCPSCGGPDACGLSSMLGAPVNVADLEALLSGHEPDWADEDYAEFVDPDSDASPATSKFMEDIPLELQAILLQVFVEDTAGRLDRIETSLGEHDLRAVGREAHAIKSGCLQIGDEAMAACCDHLRQAAKAADNCLSHRRYKELLAAFQTVASRTPRN